MLEINYEKIFDKIANFKWYLITQKLRNLISDFRRGTVILGISGVEDHVRTINYTQMFKVD